MNRNKLYFPILVSDQQGVKIVSPYYTVGCDNFDLWKFEVEIYKIHIFLQEKGSKRPQSRQSAKRFSSRWNWDSPTPLAAGECAPPPFGTGGGHTRWQLKGWGSPNSNERTYTVVLYIYKYFVISP